MNEDIEPRQEEDNAYTGNIMCSILDTAELTPKSYSDQTGKFPVTSSRGNQYIFILYHFDTNTIHDVPLKVDIHLALYMLDWNVMPYTSIIEIPHIQTTLITNAPKTSIMSS